MSSINVSDSTPSLQDDKDDEFSEYVKAFSKKMKKIETDHEKHLMALLSSADSLGQVKQILSDKGELSEDMQKVFDRAIKKEEEQKQASEVPIKRIINKIRIIKKRARQRELSQLINKNEVELKKAEHYIFTQITTPQRKERQALWNVHQTFLAEYVWTMKELNPCTEEEEAILASADSWPDYPEFEDTKKLSSFSQMAIKISQESDEGVLDSDKAYKKILEMKNSNHDKLTMVSPINVSDSTPSFKVDGNDGFSKRVKALSKKMEKFEADHEERLMALLSSANSLRQVKQLLSDEGELSEGIKEVFDRAIKKEDEEKKASEVPIKRIINKIRIIKKRERQHELNELLKKNKAELTRPEHYLSIKLTPSQLKERQAQLDLEQDLLAEYLWILKEISPNTHENAVKLQSAESWPDYPEFEDTSPEDPFQKLCEEYLKRKNSHIDAYSQQPIF